MKTDTLQKKSKEELQKLVTEKRAALREFRFKAAGGSMTDVKAFRAAKKDIAVALTLLNALKDVTNTEV